eukprot:COSAG01_NODE_76_length_28332_cov_298.876992_17_plen_500_part_00
MFAPAAIQNIHPVHCLFVGSRLLLRLSHNHLALVCPAHVKNEAAAEAHILNNELACMLRTDKDKIFLDSDNLIDLRRLTGHVQDSDVLILLVTDGVLSRPWCLVELNAAAESKVPILLLFINNSHRNTLNDISSVETILSDLPTYLQSINPSAITDLSTQCLLDAATIGPRILAAITKCNADATTLTLDPKGSSVRLQTQFKALADAMATVACPKNKELLPDLAPTQRDQIVTNKPIALYIVYSADEVFAHRQADKMRDWLCRWCDFQQEQIVLCAEPKLNDDGVGNLADGVTVVSQKKAIPGVHTPPSPPSIVGSRPSPRIPSRRSLVQIVQTKKSDLTNAEQQHIRGVCDNVQENVDTVILLQSEKVRSDPRCLACLFVACKAKVPIVAVNLTSSETTNEAVLWKYDTARTDLFHLGTRLDSRSSAIVTAGTGGVSATDVGIALSRKIPFLISKPLEIDGTPAHFNDQMLDIEIGLRHQMPTVDGRPYLHQTYSEEL